MQKKGTWQRANDVAAEEMAGSLSVTRRSVGTLQRDTFEWHYHKDDYSEGDYTLAVSLQSSSWLPDDAGIPLAVVVRIEDTTGSYQELYAQVQARVRAAVRVRA